MKKAKRALALFLALCMILSMNAVLGSAIAGRHFSEVNEADADMSVTLTSVLHCLDTHCYRIPKTDSPTTSVC